MQKQVYKAYSMQSSQIQIRSTMGQNTCISIIPIRRLATQRKYKIIILLFANPILLRVYDSHIHLILQKIIPYLTITPESSS
jgi:hypothetical protein